MVRFLFFILFFIISINKTYSNEDLLYIAHAGGEIDGFTYTNSSIAINQSIKSGYKFIELDLHLNYDEYFYGFHDFDSLILKDKKDLEVLDDFKKKFYNHNILKKDLIIINKKLKYPMILEDEIINIFKKDTSLNLVTDKTQNFEAIKNKFGFMNSRLFIEIFSKKNYLRSLFYPLENRVYFTRSLDFLDRLFIRFFKINNVVFDKKILKVKDTKKILIDYRKRLNINFFTYTVNIDDDLALYSKYLQYVYTDNILTNYNNGEAKKN